MTVEVVFSQVSWSWMGFQMGRSQGMNEVKLSTNVPPSVRASVHDRAGVIVSE